MGIEHSDGSSFVSVDSLLGSVDGLAEKLNGFPIGPRLITPGTDEFYELLTRRGYRVGVEEGGVFSIRKNNGFQMENKLVRYAGCGSSEIEERAMYTYRDKRRPDYSESYLRDVFLKRREGQELGLSPVYKVGFVTNGTLEGIEFSVGSIEDPHLVVVRYGDNYNLERAIVRVDNLFALRNILPREGGRLYSVVEDLVRTRQDMGKQYMMFAPHPGYGYSYSLSDNVPRFGSPYSVNLNHTLKPGRKVELHSSDSPKIYMPPNLDSDIGSNLRFRLGCDGIVTEDDRATAEQLYVDVPLQLLKLKEHGVDYDDLKETVTKGKNYWGAMGALGLDAKVRIPPFDLEY